MNWSLIAICAAVAALFAAHIVSVVKGIKDDERREREIERLSRELKDAINNGHVARAAILRSRLQRLVYQGDSNRR